MFTNFCVIWLFVEQFELLDSVSVNIMCAFIVCTNPSDLIRKHKKNVEEKGREAAGRSAPIPKKEKMDPRELAFGMKDEYGLTLKKHVMDVVTSDLAVEVRGSFHMKSTSYVMENFKRVHD